MKILQSLIAALVVTISALSLACGAQAQPPRSVRIVDSGRAVAAIHTPTEPTAPERFAAEELQRYIEKATGARLAIKTGPARAGAPVILVATVARLPEVGERPTSAERALGVEGIGVRVSGGRLLITGGGPRGVVYSAYHYLETLGYRWYWPGETGEVTPKLSSITASGLRMTHEPSFERRHALGGPADWSDVKWGADVVDWAVKNRLNFWLHNPPGEEYEGFVAKRGGTHTKIGSGHNWQHIIPPATYFAEHPEWFPEIGGKRVPEGMLCLTNPQVLQKLTDYAMAAAARMESDPDVMFIDMSQNDGHDWCECDQCRAIDDRDPSTRADIMLWALNQIAEKVTARYPNAKLFTMAYAGAVGVPSWIEPHPSIFIELCNYCFNYGASFVNPNSGRGRQFKADLDTWAPVAGELGVYEYFGFYNWLEAFPVTLYRLPEETAYYKRLGVTGFYSETQQRWSTNHLLYYAFTRMWWDHRTDVEELIDEFVRLFYGPAAEPMRRFHMTLETSGGPDRYWSGDEFNLPGIFTPEVRATCRAALDEARARAQDEETIIARLDFVELGWRYTELHLEAMEAHAAARANPTPERKRAAKSAWQEYVAWCDRLMGTHAFEEVTYGLPLFRDRGARQLALYDLDLTALPAGEFTYSDYYGSGGNARLHAQVAGFYDGIWGLSLYANGSGSIVYELGAQPGHHWTSFQVGFDCQKDDTLRNAIEFSLDGETWTLLGEDTATSRAVPFDITEAIRGAQRFWVRCRYQSLTDNEKCAITGVALEGRIE